MDHFIPAPPVNKDEIRPAPPAAMTPEVQATIKQAEVVADPRFLDLMKFTALAQQTLKTVGTLQTAQDQENAIVFFDRVKKAIKAYDDLRHEWVDFPTKFTQLVNAMFRTPTQQLEQVKAHFSSLLSSYDAMKRKEAEEAAKKAEEAAREQAAAGQQGQEQLPIDTGMAKVVMEPQVIAPPPNTTKVAGTNAKVTMREVVEMKIVDPVKLLKAIASDGERNKAYTLELVSFNELAIKKLCEGKRKIPGVQWEKVKRAV